MSIIQLEYYNRYGEFLRTSTRVFEDVEDAISYVIYIVKISRFGLIVQRPSSFRVRWLTLKSSACRLLLMVVAKQATIYKALRLSTKRPLLEENGLRLNLKKYV